MSEYQTKYGATFGDKHSFRDWGLLPVGKPIIAPPKPKTYKTDVPCANGDLDYTEALTGSVQYENREGTFKYAFIGSRAQFDRIYHKVLNAVHGKKMRVILDEDSGGYYEGRLSVDEPEYDRKYKMTLTITGDFFPYKYSLYSTLEPWVWDTFSFVDGFIAYYSHITISEPQDINVVGTRMPVVPNIILESGSVTVVYYAAGTVKSVQLQTGDNETNTPDLILSEGSNVLRFRGNGVISIDYRGGSL